MVDQAKNLGVGFEEYIIKTLIKRISKKEKNRISGLVTLLEILERTSKLSLFFNFNFSH